MATSLVVAIVAFAGLSGLFFVLRGNSLEEARLKNRNEMERSMSLLLASLRDHADFGSAIKDDSRLSARIMGVAVYSQNGGRLYTYGRTPETFTTTAVKMETDAESRDRGYIEQAADNSVVLLLTPMKAEPPFGMEGPGPGGPGPGGPGPGGPGKNPPPPKRDNQIHSSPQTGGTPPDMVAESVKSHLPEASDPGQKFRLNVLQQGSVIYLEMRAKDYWNSRRIIDIAFPMAELMLAAVILGVYLLILRNDEYKRRLEEQQNLVVLGTAASTIAHDMKNPLLAIRLQTSILERTCPEGKTEIANINDEVDRLSSLCYRVNDYLRDPLGQPERMDLAACARETGRSLLGTDVLTSALNPDEAAIVMIDPARVRSIIENLLRNAMESGSPREAIRMELLRADGGYALDVLDEGCGISKEDRDKLFNPFFTTKSKGTGIGLSVCRRFVSAAGGSISLTDREGGGVRARMTLPAARSVEAHASLEQGTSITGENAGKPGDIHNTDDRGLGGF